MAGNPKFRIYEKDGVELTFPPEYVPEAQDILYETGGADTLKDKIDATAFPYGFGLENNPLNDTFEIPADKLHVSAGLVTNDGLVINNGIWIII